MMNLAFPRRKRKLRVRITLTYVIISHLIGSLPITAVRILFKAMSAATYIQKFAFASESCVPIVSVAKALEMIYTNGIGIHNNGAGGMYSIRHKL